MSITAERLNALLKENGYNPNSLSIRIGVSPSAIRKWLNSDADLVLANILKIADLFDCSLDYIAGRSDDDGKCGSKLRLRSAYNCGKLLMKARNPFTIFANIQRSNGNAFPTGSMENNRGCLHLCNLPTILIAR